MSNSRKLPTSVKDCKNVLLFAHVKATEECRQVPLNTDIPVLLYPERYTMGGYVHGFSNHTYAGCKTASEAVIELANHCMKVANERTEPEETSIKHRK